ncbi:MAG: type I polyketide synthase, partial [Pseudomonadota bacterium]
HAVIRGYATNNDGDGKVSYTAPSPEGQAEVISLAMGMADINARSIGYMEAHGTATPLGDPIEVAGLTSAHRQYSSDTQYCALGSVKGNLGHLDVASGAIGVIKTALTLRDGVIPPLAHFEAPNPKIDFENSPFYVNTGLSPWPETDYPRRAGVSSFGVGGTNAHVVMEAPPAPSQKHPYTGPVLLPISARTSKALENVAGNLAAYLPDATASLGDMAATLQRGRKVFARRDFVVAETAEDAATAFSRLSPAGEPAGNPRICFLFTGQGAQYPGMGAELYEAYPTYRDTIDRVAEALLDDASFGRDLRDWLLDSEADADDLQQTAIAQPALFAVEAAMASLLTRMGLFAEAVIGHSVGEVAAAVTAGVMSLDDAARFVARRGQLMGEMPVGAMLGVKAPQAQVEMHLTDGAVIAGVNSPMVTVVSGLKEAISATAAALAKAGIDATPLAVSHGFHSPGMAAAAKALGPPKAARSPSASVDIYSTMTGDWIDPGRWTEAGYWQDQMLGPVLFASAVEKAAAAGIDSFIEVGPGGVLTALTLQTVEEEVFATPTIGSAKAAADARLSFLTALGHLWSRGGEIDWDALQPGPFQRVKLPTYPFERKRFWIEPKEAPKPTTIPASQVAQQDNSLTDLVRQQLAVVEAQLA